MRAFASTAQKRSFTALDDKNIRHMLVKFRRPGGLTIGEHREMVAQCFRSCEEKDVFFAASFSPASRRSFEERMSTVAAPKEAASRRHSNAIYFNGMAFLAWWAL